ncbi:protein DCL, chloroplastic [Ricinus communis]|uniref:DCL protein, chloroplast, putative n=1 Tax=Ricinus communis TaxID=3988 RepID=B9R7B7_RICCO|nr:protein DCL, chloroplastic [Ricinus communis]EEF52397.1 DCL protein, chloroplast precursor, putative [Ricinus communis]|eukprot:XP_002510210.1 protein DCL, chloroplastic [Ricinus communis]
MTMASLSKPPPCLHGHYSNPISLYFSPVILSFPFHRTTTSFNSRIFALKTGSDGSDLLRKPIVPSEKELSGISDDEEDSNRKRDNKDKEDDELVDWEDQILEDTVPLVGFVRMILHSGKYENGDRLSPEHERTIVERLLPFHPECEKKIGPGIDYITVGHHTEFENSRCLFIVRKDGKLVDFSYWKCIKGLIRKNYPLYADSFILRHFRRRRQS